MKTVITKSKTFQKAEKQKQHIFENSKNLNKKMVEKNGGIPPCTKRRTCL